MRLLKNVVSEIERFATPDLAIFDYVGLLNGDMSKPIFKVGLTLDYSLQAIEIAIEDKCDLLITHHGPTDISYPLIGNNLAKIELAARSGLAIYRSHLSLDFCEDGIIDSLCRALNIPARKTLLNYEGHSIFGGVNLAKKYPLTLNQLQDRIANMGISQYRVAGAIKTKFSRIAVTSGAGFFGDFMDQLCPEVYIAGEFEQEATKYAEDLGIMLIELGHHQSESTILARMVSKFSKLLGLPVQFIEIPDTIQTIKIEETI